MKRLITSLITVFVISTFIYAQSPDKMSYQAVVRDNSNNLVANQTVGMQISILQGSSSGTAVYEETHTPTSNVNGLVTVVIGNGTVVSGDITTIDWENGPYYIKSETDPTGGSNYTITGSSELLSVPYALHAKSIDQMGATIGDVLEWDGTNWAPGTVGGTNYWTQTGTDLTYDAGNVSIGSTSNFGSKLFIVGDGTQRVFRAQSPSGTTKFLIEADGGVSIGSGLTAGPADGLLVGGETILDANTTVNGNVGINAAIVDRNFHVVHDQFTGTGGLGGLAIENTSNGAQWTLYTSQSSSELSLYFGDNLRGNFDDVSGNYTSTSDERLKMNITSLEGQSSLERLLRLEPREYEYKSKPGEKYLGFVAQELQEVIPEVVKVNGNDGGEIENLLTVSYAEIIPLVVSSVKEQQKTIDELKKENEELKAMLKEVLEKIED